MKQKTYWYKLGWRLVVILVLALSPFLISPPYASAQDLSQSLQLTFDPVTFDKKEIQGSEAFRVTIKGRLTCTANLPVPVSEANIISQVIALHATKGTQVTLNPSYTITIKPFPSKKDEFAEINQSVPLQFPATAEPGDYNVVGKIVEAKVKVVFASLDVASYLPQEQPMGMIKLVGSGSTTSPPPTPTPSSTPTPPPPAPKPAPAPLPAPTPTPTSPLQAIVWWVWLIVLVAVFTIIFNIIWFLRHRNYY